MVENYYSLALSERRRVLADAGFVRGDDHIWRHPDGRAIGEGVMAALIDDALLRYLKIDRARLKRRTANNHRRRTKRVN